MRTIAFEVATKIELAPTAIAACVRSGVESASAVGAARQLALPIAPSLGDFQAG